MLIVVHLLIASALLTAYRPVRFVVWLDAPIVSDGPIPGARVPDAFQDRVSVFVDGAPVADLSKVSLAPGMHRISWGVTYRGGIERRVGVTRLAGPRHRAGETRCGIRLHVSESLLRGGGRSGRVSLAQLLRRRLSAALSGLEVDHLGVLRRVGGLSLDFRGNGVGALAMSTELHFEHGRVPLSVTAQPAVRDGRLDWRTTTSARVEVSDRARRFLVNALRLQDNIDRAATRKGASMVASLKGALAPLLSRPPDYPLSNGRALSLSYCEQPIEIRDRSASAHLGISPEESDVRPVDLVGADEPPPFDTDASVAADIDLDTLNIALHTLWVSGTLDETVGAPLVHRFNTAAEVRRFLSLSLASMRFTLPPMVARAEGTGDALAVSAEAEVVFEDAGERTRGFLFVRMNAALSNGADGLGVSLSVADMALSCEVAERALSPCYTSLLDLVRGSIEAAADPLGDHLAAALERRFGSGRLTSDALNAVFSVRGAEIRFLPDGDSGWLRVAFDVDAASR